MRKGRRDNRREGVKCEKKKRGMEAGKGGRILHLEVEVVTFF